MATICQLESNSVTVWKEKGGNVELEKPVYSNGFLSKTVS